MKRYIILLFFAFSVSIGYGQDLSRERYEIRNNMPLFFDHFLAQKTFPLAWRNAAGEDFAAWNRQARSKIIECMLTLPPDAADNEYTITGSEKREGYTAYKIEFSVSAWSRVPAYLLVPDGEGPFPALVALHDHTAEFFIGKEKMVRPFDERAEVLERAVEFVTKNYDGRFTGDEFARNGYAVLAIDALFWGERGRVEGIDYDTQQALAYTMMQAGMCWNGLMTYEDSRCVSFVASLPFVDEYRVGAYGFSMGGHRTWMLSAVSEQVAAAASVCSMNTLEGMLRPGSNKLKGHSAWSMLLPDLANYLDLPHIASVTCPRPLMVINGSEDKLFPVDAVENAYNEMQEVWQSQNVPDRLVTGFYPSAHRFTAQMQADVLAFFDKHLKENNITQ